MITLYRGDDTTFKGVKRLRVTIESKESLAGCSATFEVCGVVKHVPDVSTGSFYLSLTGEDTAKMPLGTHTATLRVYDDESRRRTVANTIMVCVTERIGDAYPGEEDIAVSLGAMVEWRNVSDKPSVNGVVLEGNKTTKELGIKGVVEATLVDLPEDYTPEGLRAAVNAINACLRASMACAAVAACALFAPCAAWAEDGEAEASEGEAAAETTDGEAPSRVTMREFGDMTSMNKQFKALSNLTAVVTAVDLDGLAPTSLSNGVVVVDGEKSAALDAGDGRTVGAATETADPRWAGELFYELGRWDFSGKKRVVSYKDGTIWSPVVTNSYDLTSSLYPDGGRVLTSNIVTLEEHGNRGAVATAVNADKAAEATTSKYGRELRDAYFFESKAWEEEPITLEDGTVWTAEQMLYMFHPYVRVADATIPDEEEGICGWTEVATGRLRQDDSDEWHYWDYELFKSRLIADGTDFVTEKTMGKELAANGYALSPTPALTEEQTARGLTYEKNGIMQDGAVQIGRHAVATVDPAYVENAPSGTVLRSVSVAIGDYADARTEGDSKSQGIAVGWFAQAKANNAIAIGAGAQHTNETAMSGNATVATGACSVAIGYTAKATAHSAYQFGAGTNATPHSLQFENVPIVRNGKLAVDETINTNDVEAIIDAYLAPRSVEELPPDGVLKVKSHAITTFAPTNATMTLDEIIAEATATRNYEIYIPNVAATREGLPLNFDTEDASLAKVGPWWGRKALRLPMLVKVREPIKNTVILGVETYDDGWDWTPAVTNAEWEATEDGAARRLKKVRGYNLQGVTAVRVAYEGTDGATNVVASTAVGNALYGTVWPTIADIAEADIAAGTEVVVSVVADGVSAPKATLNALTESVTEILKSEKEGWR